MVRLFAIAFTAGLLGCGVMIGNPGNSSTTTESNEVSGEIDLGKIKNANVRLYALNDDGSPGALLATTTSDQSGSYKATIAHTGAIMVIASGGTYIDEATGEEVSLAADDELQAVSASVNHGSYIGLNALTTIAAANARRNAGNGLSAAIHTAHNNVAEMFGISGVDVVATRPDNYTDASGAFDASTASTKLGGVIGTLSQLAYDSGLQAQEGILLIRALSEDYADGGFDGLKDGAAISVSSKLAPPEAMAKLETSATNYGKNPRNRSNIAPPMKPPAPPIAPTSKPPVEDRREISPPPSGERSL